MSANRKTLAITKSGILLCEGKDEVNFFNVWLAELGLTDVQVMDYEGKQKLAQFLSDITKLSGFNGVCRLGITRDADEDAKAASDSVAYCVQHAPEAVCKLAPGIFILPGEGKAGALESLWLDSLANDPMASCVEDFFCCIETKGWKPSQVFAKNDKARAQLWIATKDMPNQRFGLAAGYGRENTDKPWRREKWIDFDHPAFSPLKQFLIDTFRPQL